jgi:copper chaperone CopZ
MASGYARSRSNRYSLILIPSSMTHTYHTNINCGGCIAKVTPFLDGEPRIQHWSVDTDAPHKPLTVASEGMTSAEVIALVQSAGFRIEPKKKGLLGKLFG